MRRKAKSKRKPKYIIYKGGILKLLNEFHYRGVNFGVYQEDIGYIDVGYIVTFIVETETGTEIGYTVLASTRIGAETEAKRVYDFLNPKDS